MGRVDAAGGPIPFALERWNFEKPVFKAIRRVLPSGRRVLEVGCGAGILTALLAHHGYEAVGVDEDQDIVDYARKMACYFRSPIAIERASALDLSRYHGRFDLVFSLGVVEHFDTAVTAELLREQARCAPLVVAAVPTQYVKYVAKITDERIYSRRQFETLVRRAGLRLKVSDVYGNIPTMFGHHLQRLLPRALYHAVQRAFSYGMSIYCVAERAVDPAKAGARR